jgi:Mn2+/Fe2+ NRAMP family transporter
VNFFARLYYPLRKAWKAVGLYLVIAGPGIVVMVADNDAGGITTTDIASSPRARRW